MPSSYRQMGEHGVLLTPLCLVAARRVASRLFAVLPHGYSPWRWMSWVEMPLPLPFMSSHSRWASVLRVS